MSALSSCQNLRMTQSQIATNKTLSEYLIPIYRDMDQLEKQLKKQVYTHSPTLQQMLQHVFSSVGKRIRPAIYFLTCNMLNYRGRHKLPVAVAIEYVHTASLLHDDVVDNSKIRRNKPTLQTIWGCESAVLVGDSIYATASELLATTNKLDIVASFARTIRLMSEGELLQLEHVFDFSVKTTTYLRILQAKTGTLLGASCSSAGVLAGLSSKKCHILYNFGKYLGLAFQLVDDALDFNAINGNFGKEKHKDLLEGRITLPLILLQQQASKPEITQLINILQQKKILPTDVSIMKKMVKKYNTAKQTQELARKYTQKALSILTTNFEPSQNRLNLEQLTQELVNRAF